MTTTTTERSYFVSFSMAFQYSGRKIRHESSNSFIMKTELRDHEFGIGLTEFHEECKRQISSAIFIEATLLQQNSEVCGGKNHEFPPYKVHNIIHNVPPCSACKLGHLVLELNVSMQKLQQMLNLGSLKLFRDEMPKNFERENLSLEDMTQSPWHDLKRCLAVAQWT